jgi:hypothetical protein
VGKASNELGLCVSIELWTPPNSVFDAREEQHLLKLKVEEAMKYRQKQHQPRTLWCPKTFPTLDISEKRIDTPPNSVFDAQEEQHLCYQIPTETTTHTLVSKNTSHLGYLRKTNRYSFNSAFDAREVTDHF